MSNVDYTLLFEKIQMMPGQVPEFPLDLLMPSKKRAHLAPPPIAQAFIYESPAVATTIPNAHGPAFVYGGDSVIVPTFDVAATGPQGCTRQEVEDMINAKINSYCKEMIQFEQKHGFLSTRQNRIIVSIHGIRIYDDNANPGGYYGWDEVGFLILRK